MFCTENHWCADVYHFCKNYNCLQIDSLDKTLSCQKNFNNNGVQTCLYKTISTSRVVFFYFFSILPALELWPCSTTFPNLTHSHVYHHKILIGYAAICVHYHNAHRNSLRITTRIKSKSFLCMLPKSRHDGIESEPVMLHLWQEKFPKRSCH